MIGHWLIAGWRSLVASPIFSFVTVASLSVGCCGALLAGSVLKQHFSFDRWVPHADRIVQILYSENDQPNQFFLIPGVKPALDGKITGIKSIVRVIPSYGYFSDDRSAGPRLATLQVDPEYLDVFQLRFLEGSRETALGNPDSIVLTRDLADELVGRGPALGKTVERRDTGLGARTYRISGVIDNISPASHVRFHSLVSIASELNAQQLSSVTTMIRPGGLYARLNDDAVVPRTLELAGHQIGEIMTQAVNTGRGVPDGRRVFSYNARLIPLTEIHFGDADTPYGMPAGERMALTILGAASAALLIVSAFNHITMSLARSLRRRREVAVRKVVGASASGLAAHYLAESGLVTAISLVLGFVLAEFLHPWFARTVGQPEVLFQLYDPGFLAVAFLTFLVLATVVGAYPAFYLARTRPSVALEEPGWQGPSLLGRALSGGLLGFQIVAATILIIFATAMVLQARYVSDRSLGFSTHNLQFVSYYCPDGGRSEFAVQAACDRRTMDVLRNLPGVKRASLFGGRLFRDSLRLVPFRRSVGGDQLGETAVIEVGPTALEVMQAKLLAGRMFDPNSAYDLVLSSTNPETDKTKVGSVPVIVTRAILQHIEADTPEAAIGQRIHLGLRQDVESLEIVGVVEDWHQRSLRFAVNPIVFAPDAPILGAVVEIDPADVAAAEAEMQAFWAKEMYGMNSGLRWRSASSEFEMTYDQDSKLLAAVGSFAGIAILVAALGVFGLSAFDVRRRVREIGIRKALGASPANIARLVLSRQVLFAALLSTLAWPLGYWIADQWLVGYAYRTPLSLVAPPAATLIVTALVALAVGLNATRAAAVGPSVALRES